MICPRCGKAVTSLKYDDGDWACRRCVVTGGDGTCRLFEYGVENPMDPRGSTAHIRDIKARRIDPKTKTQFYYEAPKTYFFKK